MFVEIGYSLNKDTPVYPTSPKESFEFVLSIEHGAPNNASTMHHHLHNGTHVDAPLHFCRTGASIDMIPVDKFVYSNPLIISIKRKKGEFITVEDICANTYEKELQQADIVFFHTHYSQLRENNPEAYIDEFPAITLDAAEYLRKNFLNLIAVGIDTISIESSKSGPAQGFPVHKMLLDTELYSERPILVFEDVNTAKLVELTAIKRIYAFPLRCEGLEAAPVNIVAEIN